MFYHGINVEYVNKEYPILSSRRGVSRKNRQQLQDRRHLLEQFGLEPIHLLESKADFTKERCLAECFAFGDIVFEFDSLDAPMWQLSVHEVGVPILVLTESTGIYMTSQHRNIHSLFPTIPIHLV